MWSSVANRMELTSCDWQIKKQKISERGQYLLRTAQWSDCKFIVGTEPYQQEFGGHKLILAMSSPVFEAMFFGGMAEKNDPILILDVQPDAFKALLEYIYTDAVNLQSFDQACELCYAANKYMLPHLVGECTNYLWHDLFPKNACRAYEFAKLFEEPVLMEKCLQIICLETEAVLQEPSFEEVEFSTLIVVLEQDELRISSELELFKAAQRWAARECVRKGLPPDDGKSLRSVLGPAVGKIRFLTLTPSQFAEGPALSPLLTQDESFAILLNISSTSASCKLPLPEGFSNSVESRCRPSPASPDQPSSLPVQVGILASPAHRDTKFYCVRNILPQPHCLNTSILDCSVTFTVDRNIFVHGVQIPTQVLGEGSEVGTGSSPPNPQLGGSYTELLYAHLLDSDGSRLTYTHYTTRVSYGSLVEITFNRSVEIQRNKVYRVGVVLNKVGWYPMGSCTQRMMCDTVFFTFSVGQPSDSVRDGLIRAIVFSY
ncbi:BTB/POZ domain-containing protein 6-B-like isoform X2 [Zootermopsis nevadensis]|uniref:BTB/POZ domain-containing protein 6-A n=1 Tax=Zootermopsis nevadensis TaxID=136037 RepID=A0A067RJI2_ZOONE|nr:BTB/POZ domain-containing protein 6-B-like isoform X2 [Zootermopsis nevadensis]KDR23977.1 BTB/POZ domain-containing protein 6-A [Zootermopsis nevadensis]